jgi:UDPglucose 6-dehydrogenase
MEEAGRIFGDRIERSRTNYDALDGASALLIHTEWHPYRRPDFDRIFRALAEKVVIDGRNLYRPERMRELGFEYWSVGRKPVTRAD